MKKIMKFFVSLLVVAMAVVLVPVQQVHAEDGYLFIEKPHITKYKSSFTDELTEDVAFYTQDANGVTHAIGYGYFEDSDVEGNAIFAFVYASDALENKADYFVVETLDPLPSGSLLAAEQLSWDLIGESLVYLEFEFEKARYNDEYIYMYAGIFDSVSGFMDYAKMKIKNPYYSIPIQRIELKTDEDVVVGYTEELSVKYYPENTTFDKALIWSSSDESVATVDENGVVTGVSVGKTTITATTVNGVSASCEFSVGRAIEEIVFEQDVYNVEHSSTFDLKVSLSPSEGLADLENVKWEILDESVVKFRSYNFIVDDMYFVTVGPGSTTIMVSTPQGVSASCVVNVDAPIKSILISYNDYFDLYPGGSKDLGALVTYNPSNTNYDKTLTWTSSDESVATVDENGVVSAIKEGNTTITATTVGGVSATQDIRVLPHVEIESVQISSGNINMFVGESYTCYPL